MKKLTVALSLAGLLVGQFALHAQDPPKPAPTVDPLHPPVTASFDKQSLHEKFMSYAIIAVGPRAFATPAFLASFRMVNPLSTYPRGWRLGGPGFGRAYGSLLAGEVSMKTGRFLTGALLHEDFRYRPSTSPNPLRRTLHALAFTFVDKSDSGENRIAFANFAGAEVGGLVGNLYLPARFNGFRHAETRASLSLAGFAAENLLHEFRPEIRRFAYRLHLPFSATSVPKWWTNRPTSIGAP